MATPEFEDFFRATLNKVNTAFNMPIPEHELEQQWNSQADAFDQWTNLSFGEQLAWAQARAVAADRAQRGRSAVAPVAKPELELPSVEDMCAKYDFLCDDDDSYQILAEMLIDAATNYGRPAVAPVAVEALQRLREWGGLMGSTGYSADVVLGVIDWIDGGMAGSLPPLPDHIAALSTTPQEPKP